MTSQASLPSAPLLALASTSSPVSVPEHLRDLHRYCRIGRQLDRIDYTELPSYYSAILEWAEQKWFPAHGVTQQEAAKAIAALRNHGSASSVIFHAKDGGFSAFAAWLREEYKIDMMPRSRTIGPSTTAYDPRNRTAAAWNVDYVSGVAPDYFVSKLEQYAEEWSPEIHYFPGTSFIQASGTGKSRKIHNLVTHGHYVLYISHMAKSSPSGFPPRSPKIASRLGRSGGLTAERRFVAFLCVASTVRHTCIRNKISPEALLDAHSPAREGGNVLRFWVWFVHRMTEIEPMIKDATLAKDALRAAVADPALGKQKKQKRTEQAPGPDELTLMQLRDHMQNIRYTDFMPLDYHPSRYPAAKEPDQGPLLIIAHDEVRSLLDDKSTKQLGQQIPAGPGLDKLKDRPQKSDESDSEDDRASSFVSLRRAYRHLPPQCNIFALLLDTVSYISNMAPAKGLDPSERALGPGTKMFPPIYLLATMDLNVSSPIGQTLGSVAADKTVFKYGRPLWFSRIQAGEGTHDVVRLAMSKLVGGGAAFKELKQNQFSKVSQEQALAILRARLPFKVVRSDLAVALIGSFMNWCVNISEDRHLVYSFLGSEPVLAEASAQWTNNFDWFRKILNVFVSSLASGAVDAGDGGEIAVEFLCLMARDKVAVSKKERTTPGYTTPLLTLPISVKDFFYAFLRKDIAHEIHNQCHMLSKETGVTNIFAKGKLFFTHFVYATSLPSLHEMLFYLGRGAAIHCRRGQKGIDLILPVLLADKEGEYILQESNLSFILVQVKNHRRGKDSRYKQSVGHKLTAWYAGVDAVPLNMYISLYIGLGGAQIRHEVFPASLPSVPQPAVEDNISLQIQEFVKKSTTPERAAELRSQILAKKNSLTEQQLTIIQQSRQVTAAAIGFNHRQFPCLTDSPYSPPVFPSRVSSRTTDLPKPVRVPVDKAPATPATALIVNIFKRLISIFPDPVSWTNDQDVQQMLKNMMIAQYPGALTAESAEEEEEEQEDPEYEVYEDIEEEEEDREDMEHGVDEDIEMQEAAVTEFVEDYRSRRKI